MAGRAQFLSTQRTELLGGSVGAVGQQKLIGLADGKRAG